VHKAISRQIALAAVALITISVSACGGGGGGSSTPPVSSPTGPGNGGSPPPSGNPTATPTPGKTATPGPTPTPIQTATPSQTPTPMPTGSPVTTSITMLPNTNGRFGLVQIFDWDGNPSHQPMSSSQIANEALHYDSVWGAFNPGAWDSNHPGMYVSRYMLPTEDMYTISGHDLNWWKANHPDWILYACDTSNNPTKLLAWPTAYWPNDVPLDISNPQVVQYQMSVIIPYLKANGYNTMAADNTDLVNYLEGGNPNFGQTIYKGYYGCGTYDAGGNFHRAFNALGNDPAFASAMVKWVQAAGAALHAAGLKLIVNHPLYNAPTDANESALLAASDAMVYERGFTDYGKYMNGEAAGLVSNAITWAKYTQSHGIAFLITDYLCSGWNGTAAWNGGGPCPTDPTQIPKPQVDWALSTYALINDGGTDVYISPQTGQWPSYRSEYSDTYGQPCGSYSTIASNVYERRFDKALVIVNASTSSYSLTLPANHLYSDIEGRAVPAPPGPLTVGPADGYVLLTSNGCS
jgi:hypothetical protein